MMTPELATEIFFPHHHERTIYQRKEAREAIYSHPLYSHNGRNLYACANTSKTPISVSRSTENLSPITIPNNAGCLAASEMIVIRAIDNGNEVKVYENVRAYTHSYMHINAVIVFSALNTRAY